MYFLYTVTLLFIWTNLCAQTAQDYGFADKNIPELSQFEYYLGKWKSTMQVKQEDGTLKKLAFEATMEGKFLDDHKTFQSQFKSGKEFFSTDIRTFNTSTKEWQAFFLNAKAQRWHKFTSKVVDGKMTTIVKGGYSGKEKFDVKVIDSVINEDSYTKKVYHSSNQMKTWELVYKMSVEKVK